MVEQNVFTLDEEPVETEAVSFLWDGQMDRRG